MTSNVGFLRKGLVRQTLSSLSALFPAAYQGILAPLFDQVCFVEQGGVDAALHMGGRQLGIRGLIQPAFDGFHPIDQRGDSLFDSPLQKALQFA
jgi:hypothetical protein